MARILGNSGGPAFNDDGDCIGVAFQVVACQIWIMVIYVTRLLLLLACHFSLRKVLSFRDL